MHLSMCFGAAHTFFELGNDLQQVPNLSILKYNKYIPGIEPMENKAYGTEIAVH